MGRGHRIICRKIETDKLTSKSATMTMAQKAQTTISPNHHTTQGLSRSKTKWGVISIYLSISYIYIHIYIDL